MIIYGADISGSLTVTGSVNIGGSIIATSVTGSFSGVATTASLAQTASSADSFTVRQSATASNMLLTGTLVAQTINVQQVTSSIVYSSGSNRFGNQLTDVQEMTGSLRVTGSGAHYILGGNVGIGTTSPTFKLDIQDSTTAVTRILDTTSGNSLVLQAGTGASMKVTGYNYNTSTAVPLYLSIDGANTVLQSGGGNVGINTTTPSYNLDVNGSIGTSGSLSLLNGANSSSLNEIFFLNNGQIRSTDDNHRIIFDRVNNNLELREYGNIIFSAGSTTGTRTDSMRITSGGNVGIGTTTPQSILDLGATTGQKLYTYYFDPANKAGFGIDVGGNNYEHSVMFAYGTSDQGRLTIGSISGSTFRTKMTISGSGNVGIGTTSPGKRLEISEDNSSTTSTTGLKITNSNITTNSRSGILFQNYDNNSVAIWSPRTGASTGVLVFGTNDGAGVAESNIAERMRITSDGYLRLATGTGGIQFNGDTAAANALDDYEEGTWTPAINGLTLTIGRATYVKIGSLVQVLAVISYSSGTGTSNVLTGLPFAASDAHRSGVSFGNSNGISYGTGATAPMGFVNSSQISFYGFVNNSAYVNADFSTFGSGDFLEISAVYHTN